MTATRTPLLSVHFSVVAHATENLKRVEAAARLVATTMVKGHATFGRQYVKGHHGNMIATISAKFHAKSVLPDALTILSQKLSESDRTYLSREIRSFVDEEGSLYLRFDKQEAYLGKTKLNQSDPIRMRLRFDPGYDCERIIDLCRKSGLAP
jgi:RNA binding exosome subunit